VPQLLDFGVPKMIVLYVLVASLLVGVLVTVLNRSVAWGVGGAATAAVTISIAIGIGQFLFG